MEQGKPEMIFKTSESNYIYTVDIPSSDSLSIDINEADRGTVKLYLLDREDMLVINASGDVYIDGRLCVDDKEIANTLRLWANGMIEPNEDKKSK